MKSCDLQNLERAEAALLETQRVLMTVVLDTPNIIKIIGILKFNEAMRTLRLPEWPYDRAGACIHCGVSQYKGHRRRCIVLEGPEHVCGLSGYNGMIDPPCPQCEWQRLKREHPEQVVRDGFTLTASRL